MKPTNINNEIKNTGGITIIISSMILIIFKFFTTFYPLWYTNDSSYIRYLYSDIPVFLLILTLICLYLWIHNKSLRIILISLSIIIIFYYYIDLLLIIFFQSRALIPEIFVYIGSASFDTLLYGIILLIVLIILIIFSYKTSNKIEISKKQLTIITLSFIIIYLGFSKAYQNKINFLGNILTLNPIYRYYNGGYIQPKCNTEYNENIVKEVGSGKNLNIILVFLESYSAIYSENAGGFNKMPMFDKIQKEGIIFKNFISNGIQSSSAHIGVFNGVIPGRKYDYKNYNLIMQPLAKYLNNEGYYTTFVSAVHLDNLNERDFLKEVGFNKIIGEEAFKEYKHYTRGSAPDEYLYERTLKEIEAQSGKFFIGLQTISFHKPYSTPYGTTEELSLKYSDEKLYNFYKGLQRINFFDKGILILVGDHRIMDSIKEGEHERFGDSWSSRSVAAIIGSGIDAGRINDNIIQHTDIYNSIKKLISSGSVELDRYYNNIFSDDTNRDWSITVKGGSSSGKNRYDIYFKSGDFISLETDQLKELNTEIYEYICSYLAFQDIGDKDKLKINQ